MEDLSKWHCRSLSGGSTPPGRLLELTHHLDRPLDRTGEKLDTATAFLKVGWDTDAQKPWTKATPSTNRFRAPVPWHPHYFARQGDSSGLWPFGQATLRKPIALLVGEVNGKGIWWASRGTDSIASTMSNWQLEVHLDLDKLTVEKHSWRRDWYMKPSRRTAAKGVLLTRQSGQGLITEFCCE